MSIKPVAVIDNGTGYTKMGFSGNCEPNYIIPTAISVKQDVGSVGKAQGGIEDLDYFIGNEVGVKCMHLKTTLESCAFPSSLLLTPPLPHPSEGHGKHLHPPNQIPHSSRTH
jgi:hypothetical protein